MIKAILAHDALGGIGYRNNIPWNVPDDLKFFKQTTLGHTVVLGRKTYDSLVAVGFVNGLPQRKTVVLSSRPKPENAVKDVEFYHKKSDLLLDHSSFFVIGGCEIYALFQDDIQQFYVSKIKKRYLCDTRIDPDTLFARFSSSTLLIQHHDFTTHLLETK